MSSSGQTTLMECDAPEPPLDLCSSASTGRKRKRTPDAQSIEDVFTTWQAATGRSGTVLDTKRRAKIKAALELYPLADVLDAVQGWQNDPFYCGQNDRRKVYNELTLLLRDAEHVERFRDMARAPKTVDRSRKATRQNGHDVRRAFAMGEMQ